MIHVDESDPVGELEPSFPYRDVTIRRGVEAKEFYDLEEEIGRGKFGTVYRCRERSTGLTLAAKFVSVPRRDDRRNVEREVDIMRQLQHPRLIQLYDAFDNGKAMCVVLELIEGGELFERVIDDDFILTEKSCTVFMRQICEGIEFIHKQNILHLDMKPENILCLTKTGNRIKIIDFGLARRFDPQKKLQVLFGTPEFVAPEVVNFDQIGYGTDMWSVGVICYVLLSGLSPFMGETDIETMANVTVAKFDFDDEAFNDISEEARDFITKLLIKNKEARMTATQCVNHPFLRRKPPPVKKEPIGLETTKDNLRSFVERWGEHPNSPYLFDITAHIISPLQNINTELTTSSHSLRGFSPSPCGSLHTSPDSVIEQDIPAADLQACEYFQNRERRASDSSCVMKKSDVSERVNLAEEIKKLSDKLFKLAMMPTELKEYSNTDSSSSMSSENTTPTLEYNDVSNLFKHNVHKQESSSKTHSYEKIIENNYTLTRSYKGFSVNKNQKNIELDYENNVSDFDRPKKFKITGFNRDVPLIPTSNTSYFSDEAAKRIRSFSIDSNQSLSSDSSSSSIDNSIQHATNTKDMLLHLLGKWDDSQDTTLPNVGRHKSISVEWTENEAQRSMNSLNTFFQSRQSVKKTHSFLK